MHMAQLQDIAHSAGIQKIGYLASETDLVRAIQVARQDVPCFRSESRYTCEGINCEWRQECKRLVAEWRR